MRGIIKQSEEQTIILMLHVEGEGWRDGDSSRMRKMIFKSERGKTKSSSLTSLIANVQLVLSQFVPNPKPAILNVNGFASFYCQMYSKHVVCLVSCQPVYYVQSEPNFTCKVTEAIFVVILGAVKINRAIHPPPEVVWSQHTLKATGSIV